MDSIERRFISEKVKMIQSDTEEKRKISGYAVLYETMSSLLGGWFKEKISRNAFDNTLKSSDVRALFNHDANLLLGRKSAGTLRLQSDSNGLLMEIDPPETSYSRDLIVSIERGDITGQSFGFTVKKDSWEDLDKETPIRTIEEIGILHDVGPVTFPAYEDTSVQVRSILSSKKKYIANRSDLSKGERVFLMSEILKKEKYLKSKGVLNA